MAPSRKGNKKQKKTRSRKTRSRRSQYGGGAASLSLPQGVDFASRHVNQHGGALLTGAPVGYTGMLPNELRMVARVGGLDESIAAAAGQRDPDQMPLPVPAQKGGRRKSKRGSRKTVRKSRKSKRSSRKTGRKSRKCSRKERKSGRKERKSGRKERKSGRKQHGGFRTLEGAELSAPTSLLPPHLAAKAGTADFSNPLLKA